MLTYAALVAAGHLSGLIGFKPYARLIAKIKSWFQGSVAKL